jgi:sigma-B regulation protein RsbU (phosphoserine phosphatase)
MLALFDEITVDQLEIEIKSGDRLVAYSDGLIEAVDLNEKMYGIDRLQKELESSFDMECNQMLNHIVASVENFAGGQPNEDDEALLIIEFL